MTTDMRPETLARFEVDEQRHQDARERLQRERAEHTPEMLSLRTLQRCEELLTRIAESLDK
jgi:hypothetical protein